MGDKADAGSTPRDWFAELTARIPSFVGYQGKGQRRIADKTVRDTMVFKLDDLREILSDVIEKANDAETSVIDDISKILRTMNELRDKAEFLGYGDTTFFTDEELNPDFLSRVYQLETQIYDNLDELETAFESPKDLGRRDTLRDIRKRLEVISQDFAARKETLKSPR
ncbi:MAG: hypothetical protein WC625_07055 [Caldisericia bacterium]